MKRIPVLGRGSVVVETFEKVEDEVANKEHREFAKAHVTTLQNSYPLKIMVPSNASDNNSVWVYPITFGGGLVGGDGLEMNFHVKNNCCAVITGQESTKVYHCEDDLVSRQTIHGQVEDGGLLCILSDPVVCYRHSDFIQTQKFEVCSGGNLVYLDWLIGGRVALDELWNLNSYENKTDVYIDEKLVYRDNYHLQDIGHVSVKQAMSNSQVLGSCILIGSALKSIITKLNNIFGQKKVIGEHYDKDVTCSVSPLKYTTEKTTVSGLYIRFMATSSTKAYSAVISHIVEELLHMIGGNPFAEKY